MHCVKKVTDDLLFVGGNDRRIALFENFYPVPEGMSYNSYLLLDEKTVLLDTVDRSISSLFLENVEHALGGRPLDYLVVNHMEPDHCATMEELVLRYPDIKIVCNQKTLTMIKQFYNFDIESRAVVVKENDTLQTGRHTLTFVMAPMVHWPEVMVTYDLTDKILFSADAFGTFGAVSGSLFADEVDFEHNCMDEARRYYVNIVGKYGTQVQALLKKASALDIQMICPLHGYVFRGGIGSIINKYIAWSSYTPEEKGVLICCGSIYGGTENAAEILAAKLNEHGIHKVKLVDVASVHPSYIVADAFRYSHIVFASATYNAGIFTPMETLLHDLGAHNLQNRTAAVIENGTWAPTAAKLIKDILSTMKNMTVLDNTITLKSRIKETQNEQLDLLANAIALTFKADEETEKQDAEKALDPNAFFKVSYGLFVLCAKDGDKQNGCIINTVMQITDTPKRLAIALNKSNFTHDLIAKSGVFNISVLTETAPFSLFQHFGFQSGKDTDKFEAFADKATAKNGVYYLTRHTNAVFACKVIGSFDYGTHTLLVADVTEAEILSDEPSVTYDYYFKNIKPDPNAALTEKKGYVCKICGYVYEGDELPEDFVCPICKHGAEDFEKIK